MQLYLNSICSFLSFSQPLISPKLFTDLRTKSDMIYIGSKKHQYYKSILMMVDLGMHEAISSEIYKCVPRNANILDFGCGQGALSQRLIDNGYNVTSVDKEPQQLKCKGAKFIEVDFDSNLQIKHFIDKYRGTFDAVVGIEVIEHVENQWEYLRGLKALCKDGGFIFVSTPNTQSWLSRLQFLRNGRFHQFSDFDLTYGHISPLTLWELSVISKALNLNIVKSMGVGTLPAVYISSLKTLMASLLGLFLRPFQVGQLNGWCMLTILKK